MKKCKICHTAHPFDELDDFGRCRSCRDVYMAARAGLHYGDYIARKPRPFLLPFERHTPLWELPIMQGAKICRICGKPIPPESGRRTLCGLACQQEANRQSAKSVKKAGDAEPERLCIICGRPIPSNMRRYCTPECAHEGALITWRESKQRRTERMKNCDKLEENSNKRG